MYDINTKNVKKGKKFYFIFVAVGILFLGIMGGIVIHNYTKLNSLDGKTMSTRIDVNSYIDDEGQTMYSPIYYYVVHEKEYSCASNSSSSINPGTENKPVYYDTKNPSNCMTEYSKSSNWILIAFMLLPIIFIVVGVLNMIKVNKRVKQIEELNQKGKLVKNLLYRLENTGMVVNNVPVQRPVVEYTLPTGSTITLYGDPRHDKKTGDADGMVDLVIDEQNPDNYYIDFEINRIGGNLPSDYLKVVPSFEDDGVAPQNQAVQNNQIDYTSFIQQQNAMQPQMPVQPQQPMMQQPVQQTPVMPQPITPDSTMNFGVAQQNVVPQSTVMPQAPAAQPITPTSTMNTGIVQGVPGQPTSPQNNGMNIQQ